MIRHGVQEISRRETPPYMNSTGICILWLLFWNNDVVGFYTLSTPPLQQIKKQRESALRTKRAMMPIHLPKLSLVGVTIKGLELLTDSAVRARCIGESFQCVLVLSWCIYISPLKFYFLVSWFKLPIISPKSHRIWTVSCQRISCCREVHTFILNTLFTYYSPPYHLKRILSNEQSLEWRTVLLSVGPPHQ